MTFSFCIWRRKFSVNDKKEELGLRSFCGSTRQLYARLYSLSGILRNIQSYNYKLFPLPLKYHVGMCQIYLVTLLWAGNRVFNEYFGFPELHYTGQDEWMDGWMFQLHANSAFYHSKLLIYWHRWHRARQREEPHTHTHTHSAVNMLFIKAW